MKFFLGIILFAFSIITPILGGESQVPSWAMATVLSASWAGMLMNESYSRYTKEDK